MQQAEDESHAHAHARGWCTPQNTSTSARKSGSQATRPSGSMFMFSSSATSRLPR
jgi:hypothetical protein